MLSTRSQTAPTRKRSSNTGIPANADWGLPFSRADIEAPEDCDSSEGLHRVNTRVLSRMEETDVAPSEIQSDGTARSDSPGREAAARLQVRTSAWPGVAPQACGRQQRRGLRVGGSGGEWGGKEVGGDGQTRHPALPPTRPLGCRDTPRGPTAEQHSYTCPQPSFFRGPPLKGAAMERM